MATKEPMGRDEAEERWDQLDTPIFRVMAWESLTAAEAGEEKINLAGALVRTDPERGTWLYVDDVNGYEELTDDEPSRWEWDLEPAE